MVITQCSILSYSFVLQMVPTTHLFAASVLPARPHVTVETRTPVLQQIHLCIFLTQPVTKPTLGLHSNHSVHGVEVHLQVLQCVPRHHFLRAPRASVLIVTQPATHITALLKTRHTAITPAKYLSIVRRNAVSYNTNKTVARTSELGATLVLFNNITEKCDT
jgi:hypothetical protein